MPAFTPNLNLYKPGGGSSGILTPDEVADIDRLNANFDLLDAWSVEIDSVSDPATHTKHFKGPATGIGTVPSPALGDTYQETDGNKVLWKHDGANWLTNEGGLYLIRPTSVVNATVDEKGTVVPVNATTTVSVNGVFSSRFSSYDIHCGINFSAGSQPFMRLRNSGVDETGTAYAAQGVVSSSSVVSGSSSVGTTFWSLDAYTTVWHAISLTLFTPFRYKGDSPKFIQAESVGAPGPYKSSLSGYIGNKDAVDYDGFTLYNGSFNAASSWIKIYGRV